MIRKGKFLGQGGLARSSGGGVFKQNPPVAAYLTTKCIEFNDAGSVNNEDIEIADHASLDFTTAMSWSGWVKRASTGVAYFGTLTSKGSYTANTRAFGIFQGNSGNYAKMDFLVSSDGSNQKIKTTSVTVFDDTWKHVVWTYSANTVKCYVNGTEDASLADTSAATVNSINVNTDALYHGGYKDAGATDFDYRGRMCEVTLWSVALNQSQVTELYNGGKPGDISLHSATANCVGWWKLGNGDDVTSADGVLDSKATRHGTGRNMEAGDIKTDAP